MTSELVLPGVMRAALALLATLAIWSPSVRAQDAATVRAGFAGKLLVVACDTDMLASAYTDGKLGPAVGPDVLSVIRLDRGLEGSRVATVEVSNSVTGPPAAVAVTPDGRFAIVVETQGPRPSGKPEATMKDLAPGRKITVVDLGNPDKPTIVQQIESYERAVSVAVNAAGTLVAVAFSPDTHTQVPLVVYHLRNGRLERPMKPKVPGYTPVDDLMDAEFVPGSGALGLVYNSDGTPGAGVPRLSMLRYSEEGGVITLKPWGNPVVVKPNPYLVKFTADGRFAVVNSMDYKAPDARGTVTSIQLAVQQEGKGEPQHAVVSRVSTGKYPEGLAMSPNGRWVATANLEDSSLTVDDPKQQFFSSVSLLRMDPASGRLVRVGDFAFDGVLPEAIVFDNSSHFLASSSFGRFEDATAGGSINFWRISDRNPQPGRVELIKLNESIPVSRGPQSMALVR